MLQAFAEASMTAETSMQALGTTTSVEAVRRFLVRDGYITATAEAMLEACGFNNEVAAGPTDGW
jgi:hypothetical protein